MMGFDPSLIPTFLAVLEEGRISSAARILRLSQPAVTAQIRKLEESLGTPLFVRSVRGVAATTAGHQLADYARSIQQLVSEATTSVGHRQEPLDDLVLASSTTIAAHVLPQVLASFRTRYPEVGLRLDVGNTEVVLARVIEGRSPIGLVEGHARAAGVRLEPFVDDELVAVMGRATVFQVRTRADLARVPILWREAGSGTRAVLERALRRAKVRRRPEPHDVVLGSNEAIMGGVVAGLGVAFVSRWSAQAQLTSGRVVLVPGLELVVKRTFRWAIPTGGLQGAAARFYDHASRSPPILA